MNGIAPLAMPFPFPQRDAQRDAGPNSRSGLARQPYWGANSWVDGRGLGVAADQRGFFRAVAGDMGGGAGIAGRKVICPHTVGARIESS